MKRSKAIALMLPPILSATLFSACGEASEDPQQDTYTTKEECKQDWSDENLCEEADENAKKEFEEQYRQQHPDASDDFIRNMMLYHMFFGPRYYSGDRSVIYQGRTISPTTRSSTLPSVGVRTGSSLAARPSISSPRSVTYGGFGGSRGGSVSSGS